MDSQGYEGRSEEPAKMVACIRGTDPAYPRALRSYLGDRAPGCIVALGDPGILQRRTLALFCSVKCPGHLILKTYDLARELREDGVPVISGFHSPMEKECLWLLLRGKQPVIWCLARRLTARRLSKEYAGALSDGRLLMLSPFGEEVRRATQKSALRRNELVAALADQVFVAYAAPDGKTEALCRQVVRWGKPLLTFECPENANLLALGAQVGAIHTG